VSANGREPAGSAIGLCGRDVLDVIYSQQHLMVAGAISEKPSVSSLGRANCYTLHLAKIDVGYWGEPGRDVYMPVCLGLTRSGPLAHYRAYQIGPDGRIKSGVDLDCLDDEAAIEAAKQLIGEYDVELWHDSRIAARLKK
jgi:hypothetical protein